MFRFGPGVLARWIGVIAFACVIGALFALWIASRTFAHAFEGAYPRIGVLVAGMAAAGLAHGVSMGVAERMVLERVLARRLKSFVMLTGVGAALAWPLWIVASASAFEAELPRLGAYAIAIALALAVGALIGAGQWLALRPSLAHGGWWIPTNALAFAVGIGLAIGAFQVIDGMVGAAETAPFLVPLLVASAAAIGGLGVGITTGISLMELGKFSVTSGGRVRTTP